MVPHTGRTVPFISSVPDPSDSHVLGLPDPDPLVTGMDPDPDASFIKQN